MPLRSQPNKEYHSGWEYNPRLNVGIRLRKGLIFPASVVLFSFFLGIFTKTRYQYARLYDTCHQHTQVQAVVIIDTHILLSVSYTLSSQQNLQLRDREFRRSSDVHTYTIVICKLRPVIVRSCVPRSVHDLGKHYINVCFEVYMMMTMIRWWRGSMGYDPPKRNGGSYPIIGEDHDGDADGWWGWWMMRMVMMLSHYLINVIIAHSPETSRRDKKKRPGRLDVLMEPNKCRYKIIGRRVPASKGATLLL